MFSALLEKASEDTNKRANAARDKSDRIDLRVSKGLQSADNAKKKTSKKSKGIAKFKRFTPVKPLQPTADSTTQQSTPSSAVGNQTFTRKDISEVLYAWLQNHAELKLIKSQPLF